jgi:hypothetical protein
VRRGQAAALLAGWVASVAAAAMVTWAVLGVALGQILPTAVPSPQFTAISFPRPAPFDQDSSDPDSPAHPGRGMTRFGPATGAEPSDPESVPSGVRPTGSPFGPVSGAPSGRLFGPAPMTPSGPSGSRAGGGDLTPEQVPRERRTGSLLGREGQVLIACSAARLVDWSVLPAAGWAAAVTGKGPTGIQVEFTEPGTVVAVIAACSAGVPRLWHPGEGRSGGSGTG